jgi:hypothetical protein
LLRICQTICLGNTFESVAREFVGVLRAASISADTEA